MRVAVIDMGTNSTRLLVADIDGREIREVERRSTVTRLGRGVDTSGYLSADAIEDVCATVADYITIYQSLGAERTRAVATSAARDATNGDAFLAELRERFDLRAETLGGDREARLTYLGAALGNPPSDETLVVDIGGGSTELVIGHGHSVSFHTSMQVGVVRHTERHIHTDPPSAAELEELAADVGLALDETLGGDRPPAVVQGIGVAGTPTSLAAIELELDPYDSERVHGHELSLDSIQHMCSELSSRSLEERRAVVGLHEGRAPTIVAGVIVLICVMRAFGLDRLRVSEHDILYGLAYETAGATV